MRTLKKTLSIIAGVFVVLIIVIIIVISPLTKFLVEKYDVKYIGREVEMDWAYTNPFTGYVHLDNLVIYESLSDKEFVSMKGLSVNLAMLKMFSKTYEITNLKLNGPYINVTQYEKDFNFSDLIVKFSGDSVRLETGKVVRFNLLDINIVDGEFHYVEDETPVNYFIKNVDIQSEGYRYNVDTLPVHFSFSSGIGSGDIEGDFTINLDNSNYRISVEIDSFDLVVINQYLKDLTNHGIFAAVLDANINSSGNFKTADSVRTSGKITIADFHFGKSKNEDFASFEELVIDIVELSPKNFIYHYDSISLKKPFLRYEKYDYLDNFQTMFGKDAQNVAIANSDPNKFNLVIEIGKLIEHLSRNLLRSHYKVGRVAIYDGDIQYGDYSLEEGFEVSLNPFTVIADSVDKERKRIEVMVKSGIKPYGNFWVGLSVDPKDSSYFDLDYQFSKIQLSMFNPYVKAYTSFPFDRGAMQFAGNWDVRAGNINSQNHLVILDARVSKKVKSNASKWIPVPLAFALVRENGSVIDYEIPVTGNFFDPNFHFWDVISDLLKNILIKPVTTPYRMEVRRTEQKLEKSLSMKWEMQKHSLVKSQEKFIDKMIDFLKDNPEASITVAPQNFTEKERELIMLYEIKKQYYLSKNELKESAFSRDDSVDVERMSIKEEGFTKYLKALVNDNMLFTVQQRAARVINSSLLNNRLKELDKARQASFLARFKEEKLLNRVKFSSSKSIVPFNGFSYYNISYKGNFPDYLREAYDRMNDFDSQAPREEYKSKRSKITKPVY